MPSYLNSSTCGNPISGGKPNRWHPLAVSFLVSLTMHAMIAGTAVHGSDGSTENRDFAQSPKSLIAHFATTEHKTILSPAPSITRQSDNTVLNPVASRIDAPVIEETAVELPYASPDSIEQMASVATPPDLPLPLDPNNSPGFMRIKIFVNEDGLADYVELLESNFPEDYASTLVSQFRLAKFNPGISGGKAIKSWRIVEIDYSSS